MSGGVQTSVNSLPAVGVAGDFASANPFYSYNAGAGGLVAGANGLTVGLAAWVNYSTVDGDNSPATVNNTGSGVPDGIVHRHQQATITAFLADGTMVIPAGYNAGIVTAADLWVANTGSGQALPGQKAYAAFTTGKFTFAATGNPTTASATASVISTGTAATFTGSIAGNVLTAASVTNTIYPGAVLSGGTVASNTVITSQLTGTTGGAGTYAVNIAEQTVASASLTATPYVLDTTGGTVTGTIALGSTVATAAGTATGTVVGMGVYSLNQPATGKHVVAPNLPGVAAGTVTSGTITMASNVETLWTCRSVGLTGELVKITRLP